MKGLTIRHENLYNKGEIPLQYALNVKRYAMKKLKNFVLITLTCSMQLAFSAGYTDNAQVVSIEDVYREHTIKQPYQDCYTKEFRQRVSGDGSATNEIFGSILGGAIGNQFGGGSGKKVMTVAGALLGASIANDNERVGYKVVNKQICDTKYHYRSEKRFSHYLVTYKYNNNVYSYTTGNKPDANIRVQVRVAPIM
ncbi:hypothetical protein BSPWISOXPB_4100 [uncultured Gammaproteobacteria bacterium]|nr:hypothetical protein BSPWISOXPB_4100 [uncultured Gammaproteobacteria bacterium]